MSTGTGRDGSGWLAERLAARYRAVLDARLMEFFLTRLDDPDGDPAAEWDAFVAHREVVRGEVERLERSAHDASPEDAERALAAGSRAVADLGERFPEPRRHTPEERMLASLLGEELIEDDFASPRDRARERWRRAETAAAERDHERWASALTAAERAMLPTRGNPTRYAYARVERRDDGEVSTVDWVPVANGEPSGGKPVPDERAAELIAELRILYDRDEPFEERSRCEQAMLAGHRADLVEALLACRSHVDTLTVEGVLFRGGAGDLPFAGNPWGIPPEATLAGAIGHVWRPIEDRAPRFVATVLHQTAALALVRDTGDGSVSLAYLTRDADGHVFVVTGTAPKRVDPAAVVPVLAGPVPRPVRDLWTVHHTMEAFDRLGGDPDVNPLEFFKDESWTRVSERLDGLPPDRFVFAAGMANYDHYLFDLDVLDATGSPTVLSWSPKWGEVGRNENYWDWFEGTGVGLAFPGQLPPALRGGPRGWSG